MGLLRIMMPPKFQLLAVMAFGVAMLFIENQIQKLEESRAKLGLVDKLAVHVPRGEWLIAELSKLETLL
ncbi:Heparan sulfate 2-O-sulfotransferase 1 [Anabarilius grahami]|uniref:Heparan sulfate 2-O-sulfotransferase 1 n=1 Tax=Anabarilius grahami TaxID=495550 RepID=A0A3N0XG00_ANAGA|nr:Heparan sulfate 2-O-sulfotransferase 1 [Anabarilius grahami]